MRLVHKGKLVERCPIRIGLSSLSALVGLGSLLSACSVIVNTDATQCETDRDCAELGAAFANTQCAADKTCKPNDGSAPGTEAACTSNRDCLLASQNRPAICRRPSNTCVELLSQDCDRLVPENAITNDNAIVIGFLGPLKDENKEFGVPINRGADLALREIATTANGLPGGAGGTRRPLAMLSCHDQADPLRAANHLVKQVGVPAILGPVYSGIAIKVATDLAIPNGVLIMSPSATSPAISGLDSKGLMWRTAPSDEFQAMALAQLVPPLEGRIRGAFPAETIRIALVVKDDAYGQGLADGIQERLLFNSKKASDNGQNYRRERYDDPTTSPNFDYAALVNRIVGFKPHIVLPLGTTEGVTKVMAGIEKAWPSAGAPAKPYYLLPDGCTVPELVALINDRSDLRPRVQGTTPGRRGEGYGSFKLRYKSQFSNEDPAVFSENAYDAAYLVAMGIAGGGAAAPTGVIIADGLRKLSSGERIAAGPNDLNKAFALLSSGRTIDYEGLSGALDFDAVKGEAPADIDIWCVAASSQGASPERKSSGQYFDGESQKIVGNPDQCNP